MGLARAHFGDSALDGGLLEYIQSQEQKQEQDRIFPNHWHQNQFGNELMSEQVIESSKLSVLTLAALSDLGYYSVDFDQADDYR